MAMDELELLAPLDEQEVWAAGVTYKRSQTARMEESEAAASCYDRVYRSPRPELFMKATRHRVSGPDAPLRIRLDSQWNVPEPELTLVVNRSLRLVGFTIGNDMSSRDIEGENPLYLPQAKVYNQCCGLGPCITLVEAMPARDQIPTCWPMSTPTFWDSAVPSSISGNWWLVPKREYFPPIVTGARRSSWRWIRFPSSIS
jgi:2-dehydro-3-deoxy-D-arabinonate dehydratase